MDVLILVVFFTPMLLLVLLLVRHARRIHLDTNDKNARTEQLEDLDRTLVQTVLERDGHICQSCGTTERVGVDFRGPTPDEDQSIEPRDLEARCARCYLNQWRTLRDPSATDEE